VLGTALDGISMIVLTSAVVLPMIQKAGFDLIWFGIFIVLLVEIAEVTPPVGFNLFVLQNMTGKDSNTIARAAIPFFLCLVLLQRVGVGGEGRSRPAKRSMAGFLRGGRRQRGRRVAGEVHVHEIGEVGHVVFAGDLLAPRRWQSADIFRSAMVGSVGLCEAAKWEGLAGQFAPAPRWRPSPGSIQPLICIGRKVTICGKTYSKVAINTISRKNGSAVRAM
jgi:hypothetical protein